MKKNEIVDFLRGYSIFTIVLMHCVQGSLSGVLNKAASFGGAGVHVFILCSGFGLYLSYLNKPLGYLDFLRKRFIKIWIPYAMIILLWSVFLFVKNGVFPAKSVVSHLLLYKMFSSELDISICYPYWFISTIIQFYLFWPVIVKIKKLRHGCEVMLAISLLWSTVVGMLGLEEERPWGSFFLQYLWEFGLGMHLAEKVFKNEDDIINISNYRWWCLMVCAIGGMCLSSIMAWNGGMLKLYNDIPSLICYLCIALIIYKLGFNFINSFFRYTNTFSYELYLVHELVFALIGVFASSFLLKPLFLFIKFATAYFCAYLFKWMFHKKV